MRTRNGLPLYCSGPNLRYVARLNGLSDAVARARSAAALEVVGLTDEARKRVGAYCRGMRQRLGIAEVLMKEPRVVFLDEPTAGLDPDGTWRMLDMIWALSRERGITVFLSSHLLDQVQRISDRVGIMLSRASGSGCWAWCRGRRRSDGSPCTCVV